MIDVTGILLTKTRRDLRRRLAQFVAIGLTVFLGVLLFVATYAAYRNLGTSYQQTYQRLSFADLTATGGDPDRVAAAVRSADGVAAVATRSRAQLPLVIGDDKLLGQVIGAPVGQPAAVNRVDVTAGDRLSATDPDGVLVEQHTAKTFGLAPGDRLQVLGGSTWRTVTVRGIADSAEYLYPASSRQNVLGDPHSFAVVFAPEQTVQTLAGTAATRQALVRLTPGGRDSGAAAQVTGQLRAAGATAVQAQADQASNAVLQQDLTGYAELSVAFPALFLTAAAIAAYVLITRLVLAERRVIATFLAAGVSRGTASSPAPSPRCWASWPVRSRPRRSPTPTPPASASRTRSCASIRSSSCSVSCSDSWSASSAVPPRPSPPPGSRRPRRCAAAAAPSARPGGWAGRSPGPIGCR